MSSKNNETKYMVLNLASNRYKSYTFFLVCIAIMIRIPIMDKMKGFISIFNIFTIGIVLVLIIDYFFFSSYFKKFQWILSLMGLILFLVISVLLSPNFSFNLMIISVANKFIMILLISFITAAIYNSFIWLVVVTSNGIYVGDIYRLEGYFIKKLQKISRLKFECSKITENKNEKQKQSIISISSILDRYTYKFFSISSEFKIYLLKKKQFKKNKSKVSSKKASKLKFEKNKILEEYKKNSEFKKNNNKNIIIKVKKFWSIPYCVSIIIYFMIFEFLKYKIDIGIDILYALLIIIICWCIYEEIRCNKFNKFDRRYLGFTITLSRNMAIFIILNMIILYFYFSNIIILISIISFHIFFSSYTFILAYFWGDKNNLEKLKNWVMH